LRGVDKPFKTVGYDFFLVLVHFDTFLDTSSMIYLNSYRYGGGHFEKLGLDEHGIISWQLGSNINQMLNMT